MARHHARASFWPKALALLLLCLLAGGIFAWLQAGRPAQPAAGHVSAERATNERAATDRPAGMNRGQLEREVRRLQEQLLAKDRKIAEMEIQIKLMSEGSRTGR